MTAPQPGGSRLRGLDGLRGTAALLVFAYHAWWRAGNPAVRWGGLDLQRLFTTLDAGVCIFFVLSGYLLARPFWRHHLAGGPAVALRPYLWRRALRILPAYWLVLLVLYVPSAHTRSVYGLVELAAHALCLQNFMEYTYTSRLDPVLWTIGIEVQFYLLLPLLCAGVGWIARRAGLLAGGLALAGLCWGADAAFQAGVRAAAPFVPPGLLRAEGRVAGGSIFWFLKWFAFGMAAAALDTRARGPDGTHPPLRRGTADAVCLAALAATFVLFLQAEDSLWKTVSPWGWPLNGLLFAILVFALPHAGRFAQAFDTRSMRVLGDLSYGIYLWHWPAQILVFAWTVDTVGGVWPGVAVAWTATALSLALTLALAAASYYGLERHCMRRRPAQRPRPARDTPRPA